MYGRKESVSRSKGYKYTKIWDSYVLKNSQFHTPIPPPLGGASALSCMTVRGEYDMKKVIYEIPKLLYMKTFNAYLRGVQFRATHSLFRSPG